MYRQQSRKTAQTTTSLQQPHLTCRRMSRGCHHLTLSNGGKTRQHCSLLVQVTGSLQGVSGCNLKGRREGNGEVVDSGRLTVASGETSNISFTHTPSETGDYSIAVGGTDARVLTVGETLARGGSVSWHCWRCSSGVCCGVDGGSVDPSSFLKLPRASSRKRLRPVLSHVRAKAKTS